MIETRYQYRSRHGIIWTKWMPWIGEQLPAKELSKLYPWQDRNKLRNEFRD